MRKSTLLSLAAIALVSAVGLPAVGIAGSDPVHAMAPKPATDIVGVATADGNFKTLTALLTQAGLVDTLKGTGPFTVFAPSDKAFEKIPAETLADLKKPENAEKLKKILTSHVVSGKVMAADITGKKISSKTVSGVEVPIDGTNSAAVKVGDATVTKADIAASNGVIHVIDTVIIPK